MQSKYFFFLLMFFYGATAHSQFKKGSRMIGAAIGSGVFSAGTTTYTYPTAPGYSADNSSLNISVTPFYGCFISNNTAIGISLLVNSSYQKVNNKSISDTIFSSSKVTNTDLGLGTFLRYYFSTDKSFHPFVHVYLNVGSGFGSTSGFSFGTDNFGTYKDSYDGKSSGRIFFNTGLNLGFTKQLGSNVGIDAFAGYIFSYAKYKTETSSVRDYVSPGGPDDFKKFQPTQKFTGNGVSIGVGVQVFLDRK